MAAVAGLGRLGAWRLRFDPDGVIPLGRGGSWPSTNKTRSQVIVLCCIGGESEVPASTEAPCGQPINFPAFFPVVALR